MWRISIGYLINATVLTFLIVGDLIFGWFSNDVAYTTTVVIASITGVVLAVQLSSYYGYANMLPPRHVQALLTGESLSGVLLSGGRIVTKLMVKDERTNTIIFYFGCISLILICTTAFFTARRTKFVNYHVGLCIADANKARDFPMDHSEEELRGPAYGRLSFTYGATENGGLTPDYSDTTEDTITSRPISNGYYVGDNSSDDRKDSVSSSSGSSVPLVALNKVSKLKAMVKYRVEVMKQIWQYVLVVALVDFFTVVMFPSIVTEIVSCSLGSWMPVILMAAYNFVDCFARAISSYRIVRQSAFRCLKSGSFLRLLFLPLFLLCCLPRPDPVIRGEPLIIFFVVLFGLTNGVLITTGMTAMAAKVEPKDREMSGNLMMMAAILSMAAAVIVSYIIDYLAGLHTSHSGCHVTWSNVTSATNVTVLPWSV